MKKILFILYTVCFLLSCAKKTVPSKSVSGANNTVPQSNNSAVITDSVNIDSVNVDSAAIKSSSVAVMVIADGYGRLITPQQNLPQDAGIKYNGLQLSKGFTTQQRANLQARYQTVPPRVLYVPSEYSLNSLKGSYYIYKKKFWYWKKSDGLFYLDQKYYL